MGRSCADCLSYLTPSQFSSNQWRKGEGLSRCKSCVDDGGGGGSCYSAVTTTTSYQCHECSRVFDSPNNLNMHMQVHRPRTVPCPACGERRFRSGANVVQHLESGYCKSCLGQDKARQEIYTFASQKGQMQRYLTSSYPMLTNGATPHNHGVPDLPYHCPDCSKSFRQLSQLLQHQDQKHHQHGLRENHSCSRAQQRLLLPATQ